MARLFDEYRLADGSARAHVERLAGVLERLGPDRLADAGRRRDAIFMQQGITFETAGADPDEPLRDRPFPLDLIPRVIPADEWRGIEAGIEQRVRALNAFVHDVYHEREIVRAGLVPWSLIVSRPAFARPAHGITPPHGVYCHVAGCDLVRDRDGAWKVLEDNVRVPSGISYVVENRAAMTRLLPQLFRGYRVRPVEQYPAMLRQALTEIAPVADTEPQLVVWTPGPANSAYFEHAFLAREMGAELVEASDLIVRDDVCYMRTTRGLERVHVIYRRVDDDFADPLEFRHDSMLGVPGLVRAYRAGSVALANALGTGVADDKATYCYVPAMIRFYLGEEPLLPNVETYLLGDERMRREAMARLGELVVKPTSESGGKGVFIGPQATKAQLEEQAAEIERAPDRWIAQELVELSVVPTALGDGTVAERRVDLRPFAVFGEQVRLVPGGLTRVALKEGSMIVNSSQGGGSKDTWVLADEIPRDPDAPPPPATEPLPTPRQAGWTYQAEQQQQAGS